MDDIRKVEIGPRDLIVMRVPTRLTSEAYEGLADRLKNLFPKNECIVLDVGMSIDVFTPRNGE